MLGGILFIKRNHPGASDGVSIMVSAEKRRNYDSKHTGSNDC